jgi:hypothetical protein
MKLKNFIRLFNLTIGSLNVSDGSPEISREYSTKVRESEKLFIWSKNSRKIKFIPFNLNN